MSNIVLGHVTPLTWPNLSRDDVFGRLEAEVDRMLNDFLSPKSLQRVKGDHYPKTDVFQKGADLCFHAALPFVKKEDLCVELKDNVLTISGKAEERPKESGDDGVHWFQRELKRSAFTRSWSLPDTKGVPEVDAAFEDGVLKVTVKNIFQEPEESKPKLIDIK